MELGRIYLEHPSLYELDYDPKGFRWVTINDSGNNIFGIQRYDRCGKDSVLRTCADVLAASREELCSQRDPEFRLGALRWKYEGAKRTDGIYSGSVHDGSAGQSACIFHCPLRSKIKYGQEQLLRSKKSKKTAVYG